MSQKETELVPLVNHGSASPKQDTSLFTHETATLSSWLLRIRALLEHRQHRAAKLDQQYGWAQLWVSLPVVGLTAVCLCTLALKPLQVKSHCWLLPSASTFCPALLCWTNAHFGPLLTAVVRKPREPRIHIPSVCKSLVSFFFLVSLVLSPATNFKKVWKKKGNPNNNWFLNILQQAAKYARMLMLKEAGELSPHTGFIQQGCEYRLTHTKCWRLACFFQA